MIKTNYTGANNSSRGFAAKYTTRRFMNTSVVEQLITLDGIKNRIKNAIKEKVFCLVSLKSFSNNFISIISGYVGGVNCKIFFHADIYCSFYDFENLN